MSNISEIGGNCSGCGACFSVCEKGAIEVGINNDGFYCADVDTFKCVHCGLCSKVCMKAVTEPVETTTQYVYAIKSKSEDVLSTSTSGGAVFHLAEEWLKQEDSFVSGVTYDFNNECAIYTQISKIEDYPIISGSKYLQADSANHMRSVVKSLKDNPERKQMIVGTPCQIYGISKALKQKGLRDRVCCVELFCHGVPSSNLWKKYLAEYETKYAERPVNIEFRSKKYGWHMYTFKAQLGSGPHYMTSDQSDFYDFYFDKVTLNQSCMECPFYMVSGEADIKVGDFWGPRFSADDHGVSALIVMTDMGQSLFDKISENVTLVGRYPIWESLQYQSKRPYPIDRKLVQRVCDELKQDKSLKAIKREYRRTFSMKHRLKLHLKTLYSKIPVTIRKKLKKMLSVIRR